MKSGKSLGFGFFFLCLDANSFWQCLGWMPMPTTSPISQRPLRQHRNGNPMFLRKSSGNNNNNNNNSEEQPRTQQQRPKRLLSPKTLTSSFQTALCIVPPDECWDTLQRARHYAQDRTYHQWPPAIRLFYPFCPRSELSDVAFDLAVKVVEKYNIEPFDITLNQWTVMPDPDAMSTMLDAAAEDEDPDDNYDNPLPLKKDAQYLEIQALIQNEERIGRERARLREIRIQKKLKQQEKENQKNNTHTPNKSMSIHDHQNKNSNMQAGGKKNKMKNEKLSGTGANTVVDEFNGPSIIALEPDEKSSRRLKRLRELIRRELMEGFDPDLKGDDEYADDIAAFRPLIPIGYFATIDEGISVAKKLKGLWNPLTFSVTDLHCISQATGRGSQEDIHMGAGQHHDINNMMYKPLKDAQMPSAAHVHQHYPIMPRPTPKNKKTTASTSSSDKKGTPFGCDALVALMGEELELDKEVDEELANFVMEEGIAGGYGRSPEDLAASLADGNRSNSNNNNNNPHKDNNDKPQTDDDSNNGMMLDAKGGDWHEIEQWLDDDDDEDELKDGISMVFGRTYLFTGELRSYPGMPASSTSEESKVGGFGRLGSLRGGNVGRNFEIGGTGERSSLLD